MNRRTGSGGREEIFCATGGVRRVESGEIVPTLAQAMPPGKILCNESREPPH